jgi:nicotinamidase-related amidase
MSKIRDTHTDPEFPPIPVEDAVLVLHHMQNEFAHPDGQASENAYPSLVEEDRLKKIINFVGVCRDAGIPIIHHLETYRPGHPELRISRNGYVVSSARRINLNRGDVLVRGTWGAAVIDELKIDPDRDEFEFDNSKVDPFNCTEFEVLLTNLDRKVLILAGLMTDFGISVTARNASDRDYGVVVLSDCVDRSFGEYSEMTINTLLPYYGRVTTSDEIISEIQGSK